ncbi:MAG: 3-deoxy-7-phosphoheptulonate synthase [Deltaproteobacteria bacterium]|nr:3-deoxy-7-phosphoheptulonate synthase [Deltaproteobacteria bacterium]
MLIVMHKNAARAEVDNVVAAVEARGCTARPIPGGDRVSIAILYNQGAVEPGWFSGMPGVKETIAVTRPYKLVSREMHPHDTVIRVGNIEIGGRYPVIMAGPCAVESRDQAMTIAGHVKKAGAHIFRGGAFKPRTSPYSFQGMEEEGLKVLAEVRGRFDLPIVTEVMDIAHFDMVEAYADIIQIGTRNMQNFSLLKRAGESEKPVLLKRGMSATVDEWLMAAEYIMSRGNTGIILCERGIRTFVRHSRNTLDLSAVPVVRRESHLPVIVDPSHAAGFRDQVMPLARAACAAGAQGLMVEVHHAPETAVSDGAQSLLPDQFARLCKDIRAISRILEPGPGKEQVAP